jgi:hypothetical protein
MAAASMAAYDATPRGERLAQLEIFSDGYPRASQFWTTTRRMIMKGEVDTARAFQTLNGVASPCEYWRTQDDSPEIRLVHSVTGAPCRGAANALGQCDRAA